MNITHRFNGFYHAILTEAFEKLPSVSFREWKDTNTGGCLIFYRDEDYDEVAHTPDYDENGVDRKRDTSLKTIFKLMNIDYPITQDEEGKISTNEINNQQLCRHIVWITKVLNQNGMEFQHDIEEWERIKLEAGII